MGLLVGQPSLAGHRLLLVYQQAVERVVMTMTVPVMEAQVAVVTVVLTEEMVPVKVSAPSPAPMAKQEAPESLVNLVRSYMLAVEVVVMEKAALAAVETQDKRGPLILVAVLVVFK